MQNTRNRIVIALCATDATMLNITVPPLGRLREKFMLVIHNPNPDVPISRRDIRRMGYRGRLKIINSKTHASLCQARRDMVAATGPRDAWIIFVDAGDVLTDIDTTPARADNFAIIKNTLYVRRFSDLMHAAFNDRIPATDAVNVIAGQPGNILRGMPIRADVMRRAAGGGLAMMEMGNPASDAAAVDKMIWQEIRKSVGDNAKQSAIFMETVSYIVNDIDGDAAAAPRG